MAIAYIGLGSNLPFAQLAPADLLAAAANHLQGSGQVLARSSLYATEPVGYSGQPAFLNAALALEVTLAPLDLLACLLQTERLFGRDRSAGIRNGPRTLDLDLLLCDQLILDTQHLTLPHPRLAERRFVLAPLAEIAPTLVHPSFGETLQTLMQQLPASGENGVDAVTRMPATGSFPSRANSTP